MIAMSASVFAAATAGSTTADFTAAFDAAILAAPFDASSAADGTPVAGAVRAVAEDLEATRRERDDFHRKLGETA